MNVLARLREVMAGAMSGLERLGARSLPDLSAQRPSKPVADASENPMPDQIDSVAAIVNALPDPALILDDHSLVLHGNSLARAIFGDLRLGEHISRTTRNPEIAAAIAAARQGGQREPFELIVRRPVERHLEGAATRLAQATSGVRIPAVLVILQDISERDALARMRMEFVANASHELRTPLTALSGFIETLSGPARDDPAARDRFLGIMAEQAGRMTRLIDDLLLLSRVEMRAHLEPTDIPDLNLIAADVVRQLTPLASGDGTRLVCEALEGGAAVRGDHDELVQAVQNLVQNAIKYGRPGGTVITRVSSGQSRRGRGAEICLAVIDDGPGIAGEHVPRLTERFYRVNTATSREQGGTGLGLAIVKHIMTRHHGTVDIESEVGQGTTFTLTFPAVP